MILHDGSTDIVIKNPNLRDALEVETQIRLLRERSGGLKTAQSGPQYVLATYDIRLSKCTDEADNFKAWVDDHSAAMAIVSVFNDTHFCTIESGSVTYRNDGDFIMASITLRFYQ